MFERNNEDTDREGVQEIERKGFENTNDMITKTASQKKYSKRLTVKTKKEGENQGNEFWKKSHGTDQQNKRNRIELSFFLLELIVK